MAKATVVVIGGGAAGATTARLLSKKLDRSKHDLVLINPRAFDMWLPALVRVAVTSGSGMDELDKGAFSSYGQFLFT
jgi:NADH dehydrogenase FAD-containing subunit